MLEGLFQKLEKLTKKMEEMLGIPMEIWMSTSFSWIFEVALNVECFPVFIKLGIRKGRDPV